MNQLNQLKFPNSQDGTYKSQLDRIEEKLDQLLAKKKRNPRTSSKGYGPAFGFFWDAYPKRAGSNPKGKAFAAFNMRIKEGAGNEHWHIKNGLKRYAEFCDATGKTGTEFVMQACTFLGPDKHYENVWTIPKQKKDPAAIESPSHEPADFSRDLENSLDTSTNPYADLTGE